MLEKLKDFFKKVRKFNLWDSLVAKKIKVYKKDIEFKKELIVFHQAGLDEADRLKTESLRAISALAEYMKELENKVKDLEKCL